MVEQGEGKCRYGNAAIRPEMVEQGLELAEQREGTYRYGKGSQGYGQAAMGKGIAK